MDSNLLSMFVKKEMSKEDREKIKKLEELIIKYRKSYYQGEPEISDEEYDALEKELKKIYPKSRLFNEVGFDIASSTFSPYTHKSKMLSLEKSYTLNEMNAWSKDWDNNEQYSIGCKIDGFAMSLIYKFKNSEPDKTNYYLNLAVSRGNGFIGEDLTENVKMISDIPHNISIPKTYNIVPEIEIRGEVYMKKSVFEELKNLKYIEENSRIRNIAPGSVRQKNPLITKQRKLNFLAYNLLNLDFITFSEKMNFIKYILKIPIVEQLIDNKNHFEKIYNCFVNNREQLEYNIDGVVFRINNEKLFNNAGETDHHPKGAIAWKFKAESGFPIIENIEWQTTRTSLINPVACYTPVEVDGAILSKATLHNLSFIEDLNIKIGSVVEVARQGSVIPKILRLVEEHNTDKDIEYPKFCPVCKKPTEIRINEESMNKTKTLHCTNLLCPAVIKDKLNHYCSVMDIKGISYSTIDKLYDAHYITTFSDFYRLSKADIMKLEGFKEKSAENIINSISESQNKPFNIILQSLGINGLGKTLSLTLSQKYNTLEEIINNLSNDAENIDGISFEMSKKIVFELKEMREEIENIMRFVKIKSKKILKNSLDGKSFCITGTLSIGRNEMEKIIIENGGQISSSVSKKLDYLLCGDNAGSKQDKAKSLNIKIINESEFYDFLKDK